MRKLFFTFLILTASTAHAVPLQRIFQDIKMPTQFAVEHQLIGAPAVAGTVDILNANAGPTSAATVTVSTFVAQPDVPRNLVITPGGTTADVSVCKIKVNGTNFFGQAILEEFYFSTGQAVAVTGVQAFKSVTSVVFPANCEKGGFAATWSIGWGEKIGMKRCMAHKGDVLFTLLGGDKEATGPTMTIGNSVQINTCDLNGTMNGSNVFDIYFMQNFMCFP